jgi:hypothetical protein
MRDASRNAPSKPAAEPAGKPEPTLNGRSVTAAETWRSHRRARGDFCAIRAPANGRLTIADIGIRRPAAASPETCALNPMRNVSEALQRFGLDIGLSKLALNSQGSCALTVNGKIEIFFHAERDADAVRLSAVVGTLHGANGPALARVLLELNFGAAQNGPAAFAADPATGEALLTRELRVGRIPAEEFRLAVETFVGRAEFWADYLARIGRSGAPPDDEGPHGLA